MFSIVAGPEIKLTIPAGLCEDGPNCPLLKQQKQQAKFGNTTEQKEDSFTIGYKAPETEIPLRTLGMNVIIDQPEELTFQKPINEFPGLGQQTETGSRLSLFA